MDDIIYIYTDGSTKNNGKKNSIGGIGVYFGEDDSRNVSEIFVNNPTNQRTELYAVIKALEIVKNNSKPIMIISDSKYVIKGITEWINTWTQNGWKTKNKKDIKNKEMWIKLLELKNNYKGNLRFTWIRGHTNKDDKYSIGNYHADRLATSCY